jgi:hypothetical protein
MAQSGVAISITSITDIVAFGVGSSSILPGLYLKATTTLDWYTFNIRKPNKSIFRMVYFSLNWNLKTGPPLTLKNRSYFLVFEWS